MQTRKECKMIQQWFITAQPNRFWYPEGNDYAREANKLGLGGNPRAAHAEWIRVNDELLKYGAKIIVMPVDKKMPASKLRFLSDQVYIADNFVYVEGKGVVFSNMTAPHRIAEPAHARKFLEKIGLPIHGQFRFRCEGSSCAKLSPGKTFVIVGYGVRVERRACDEIEKLFGLPVVAIKIREPAIHTDCFAACLWVRDKIVIINREAFAAAKGGWNPVRAWRELGWRCEKEGTKVVQILPRDGRGYATNLRQMEGMDGGTQRDNRCVRVLAPSGLSATYAAQLRVHGYEFHPIEMPELFEKGGGAPACCTNRITRAVADGWKLPRMAERYLFQNIREQLIRSATDYPDHVT